MTDANIMLGNSHNLNLLFNRTPKIMPQSYDKIQPAQSRGHESIKQQIYEKQD